MKLYLVRHGKPDIAAGLCYGRSDVEVPEQELQRVAADLGPRLPAGVPIWCSPALRCVSLAERLQARSGVPLRIDARLRELDFGTWEMRAWNDIARDEIDAWAADPLHYRPGGGESVLDVAARAASLLEDLRDAGMQAAVLVCHAGTIRLLTRLHAGLTVEQSSRLAAAQAHRIEYGELLVLG